MIIILPSSAFYHLAERGDVQALKTVGPEVQREVYLAIHARRPLSLITIKMVDVIRECVEQENNEERWVGHFTINVRP